MKRSHRTFPDWLYNTLPFCYLIAGVLADMLIAGWLGALIGVVLVTLAFGIWWQRYRYRQALELSEEHMFAATVLQPDELPNGGLVQMSWSKSFECGHPVIDGQHRRLFGLANESINLLLTKQAQDKEESFLTQLIAQMTEHFATEEGLLAQAGDANLNTHKAEHQAMLETSKSLLKRYHENEAVSSELVSFLSDQLICGHIIKEDLHSLSISH